MRPAGRFATTVGAAAAAATILGALRRTPPAGADRWRRTNYRGRDVTLLAGPAAVAGTVVAASARGPVPVLVTSIAGGLGLYDDLYGSGHARGLRGHVEALRDGVVTSGLVKMVGLTALAAVATVADDDRSAAGRIVDTALVAGTANLVNLLDLRPGRALKVIVATTAPLAAAPGRDGALAAGLAGASAALLPADLGEHDMLGDCGANALGALLGWRLTRSRPPVRVLAAAAVVSLTLLSERVSFSKAIDANPLLAAIDRFGRSG